MSRTFIAYLPDFYAASPQVVALQGALGQQVADLWEVENGLINQLDISKATWGLRYWEESLGLAVDEAKDADYRRARIRSKLRGSGTTTVAMIQNVAESFSNGEVDVAELAAQYKVQIKFVGTIGIPPNMDDLTAALDEIMPAHLQYSYVYVYRTWAMVADMTWDQAAAYTWDQLREGALT